MSSSSPASLAARKQPRQARATATLEAILEATIQVLVAGGPVRLTTTRVATRAGVSVGTMYQYFPNKQALLYAVAERYFDSVATDVEHACRAASGAPVSEMAETLVNAYCAATIAHCGLTRAIYLVASDVDVAPLIERFSRRLELASAAMFRSAPNAEFADLPIVCLTLLSSLFGTVRSLFEGNLPKPWACGVQQQLIFMCRAYLEAARMPVQVTENVSFLLRNNEGESQTQLNTSLTTS